MGHWIVKEETQKYVGTMKTETMIQKLWDTAKATLRGNSIVIQAWARKQEKNIQLMEPEREKQSLEFVEERNIKNKSRNK